MSSERPARRFRDIIENIERIEAHVSSMSSLQDFVGNAMCQDAVERCFMRISEAAIKLGPMAEELVPEIPWQDVRGIGNHLRYAYDLVDPEILWNSIEKELPLLRKLEQ